MQEALTPQIDVIVPQFNQADHTLRFLKSYRQHAPVGTRLILVDNGSRHEELASVLVELQDLPHVLIRNVENLGFVRATNQGLAMSTAQFVVFQNNDTEIYAGCYQAMRDALESQPKAGVVGAVSSPCGSWVGLDRLFKIYPELSKVPGLQEAASHPMRALLMRQHMAKQAREVRTMVPFFCVMLSQKVIAEVGTLSTDYGVGLGDDDDYCARLRSKGYEVLLDLSTYVFHNHRTTFKALFTPDQIREMQQKNVKLFTDRWHGGGREDRRRG